MVATVQASLDSARRSASALDLPAPAGMRASQTHYPELESLRGAAILLVFFFHLDGLVTEGSSPDVSLLSGFVRAGHTGVSLFFVLSGFLLSR